MRFFEVYSDIGAGKEGTTHGVAMLSQHITKTYPDAPITKLHPKETTGEIRHPYARHIERLTPFFEEVLTPTLQDGLLVSQTAGNFPVIISGDHANAIGNVSAFLNHHQDKKVAIVWIDAHADLHTVYTTPSGNMHGMPLGAVLGLDNKDCQINDLDEKTHAYWERLKQLATHKPTPSDVFFLGLRSFEPPETHLIKTHDIFAVSAETHRANFAHILEDLTEKLRHYDAIYVSFDVDALDESLIPATGTPEPLGYEVAEVRAIFDKLLSLPNVGLFEMTEFNPTLDADQEKYATVFGLLDHALSVVSRRASAN